MGRSLILLALLAAVSLAGDIGKATALYHRTEYEAALRLLGESPDAKTPEGLELAGRCAYMLGDFKRAAGLFEQATQVAPSSASHYLWLGRALGRRAETSNPLAAPMLASKARQAFEKAVELDPRNRDALDDLFSYYLEAPGFLGGGLDKASRLAERIRAADPVAYHQALARIALQRKDFNVAERQLRRVIELAPKQAGHVVDLARFLAKVGRFQESDKTFQVAESLSPSNPQVIFVKAQTYVETRRHLDDARKLLEKYLSLPLTPDDPPRDEALELLKQVGG